MATLKFFVLATLALSNIVICQTKECPREQVMKNCLQKEEYKSLLQEHCTDDESIMSKCAKVLSKKDVKAMCNHHNDFQDSDDKLYTSGTSFTYEVDVNQQTSNKAPQRYIKKLDMNEENENFNPQMGRFICPDDGYYVFYWSQHNPTGSSNAQLVNNGIPIKQGPSTYASPSSFSGTSTMSTITKCDEGNSIWVTSLVTNCATVGPILSSFTGFKLYGSTAINGVAFSAFLTETQNRSTESPIIYQSAPLNLQNAYSTTSGEFTAPSNGSYVFTVSGHKTQITGTHVHYLTLRNNNNATICYVSLTLNTAAASTDTGTQTGTCILDLTTGDTVRVFGQGVMRAQLSSFMGFQLASRGATVVFSARLENDRSILDGTQIPYANTLINEGGGYFPVLGVFQCPDSARYFFTWEVGIKNETVFGRSAQNKLVAIDDGSTMTDAKIGPRSSMVVNGTVTTSTSMQAIVTCRVGRSFFVESVVDSAEDGPPSVIYDAYVTKFSGFRIPNNPNI